MKILGIGGTNGSGKDTVAHMLEERHNWLFISVTDLLREEARARGLAPDRATLRTISAEWRAAAGLGVLVSRSVDAYAKVSENYKGLVIASLRNIGEVEEVHALGGKVVWVDADPEVRYARVQSNLATRGRLEEDSKTFDEFMAEEAIEMEQHGDATTVNMSAVKAAADMTIINQTTDINAFQDAAETQLSALL